MVVQECGSALALRKECDMVRRMQQVPQSTLSLRVKFTIILSLTGLYFLSYFQRVAVPGTIFNELQSDFAMPASAVTAVGAITLFLYGGAQVFAGGLVDRYGAARLTLVGGGLMLMGAFLFPLAPSPGFLYAARGLLGLGVSAMYLCLVKELDRLFGPRLFPQLLGVALFLGYSGGLVATYPLQKAVSAFGWRASFLGAALVTAMVLACALAVLRRDPHASGRSQFSWSHAFAVLRNRDSIPLLVCGGINFMIYFLLQATIGKKFLEDFAGIAGSRASSFGGVMMLVAMVTIFLSGFILRLMGNRRKPALVACCALTFVSLCALLFNMARDVPGWMYLVPYIGFAASSSGSSMFGACLMKEVNPSHLVAASVGMLNSTAYLIMALGMNVSGMILDLFKDKADVTERCIIYPPQAYAAIFWILLAFAAVSLVASCFSRETRGVCRA